MMISFDAGESQKFHVRAACLVMKENRILFQRLTSDDYWFLPGGRVEMMEETEQTIVREMQEEYGWKVKDRRLVWVVEHFFQLDDRDYHELGFYYVVQIDEEIEVTDTDFPCLEGYSVSRWFHIHELNQHHIVPEFIKQDGILEQLHKTSEVKHIIHR